MSTLVTSVPSRRRLLLLLCAVGGVASLLCAVLGFFLFYAPPLRDAGADADWDGTLGRMCAGTGTGTTSITTTTTTNSSSSSASVASSTMPFWSRGFARSCCTSFPRRFVRRHYKGLFSTGVFEAGDVTDPQYFLGYSQHLQSGDSVYVAIADFPRFVRVFLSLPRSIRLTLVTGQEDIGAPYEIFHPNREACTHFQKDDLWVWPNTQQVTMRQFLSDPRLHRWYTQNYDLVGCNAFTCSDMDATKEADRALLRKVVPVPIGLDFHSHGEKNASLGSAAEVAAVVCAQRSELAAAANASALFAQRRLAAYGQFDCGFVAAAAAGDQSYPTLWRERTRGDACRWMANESAAHPHRFLFHPRSSRTHFWRAVTQVAFALAPPGFGTDTHRLWEILHLRTVPIVVTSPLDRLYAHYPVVVVQSWSQVFAHGALERFRQQIVDKFGDEPFASADVQRKLTVDYWVQLVKDGGTVR